MDRLRRALRISQVVLVAPILIGLGASAASASLTITTHTSTDIEGSLDPGVADFEAHGTATTATVDVTIGALSLTATGTVVSGELTSVDLDGFGSSLTDSTKTILTTLSGELDVYLDPDVATLEIHEDLLRRLVAYWAEAPVGVTIGSSTVPKP